MRFDSTHSFLAFVGNEDLRFPKRPRLVSDLDVFDIPNGIGIFVRRTEDDFVISGNWNRDLFGFLIHQLDGKSEIPVLLQNCNSATQGVALCQLLWLLFERNLLCDGVTSQHELIAPSVPLATLSFFDRVVRRLDTEVTDLAVARRLAHTPVVIFYNGNLGIIATQLLLAQGLASLRAIHIGEGSPKVSNLPASPPWFKDIDVGDGQNGELKRFLAGGIPDSALICCVGNALSDYVVQELNEYSVLNNARFLPSRLEGNAFVMGPYFDGASGACFNCAELRRTGSDPLFLERALFDRFSAANVDTSLKAAHLRRSENEGELFSNTMVLASLFAAEIVRIISGTSLPQLINRQLTIDYINSLSKFNETPQVHSCVICGEQSRPRLDFFDL